MMKKYCVYMIERKDGLRYVGKTTNPVRYRISEHSKEIRFSEIKIDHYDVLFESDDHDEILDKETYYVEYYDTFKKGLNKTPDGKSRLGVSHRFTTLGVPMSEETKAKIREKSIKNKNYLYALNALKDPVKKAEFRKKLSETRKGRVWSPLRYKKEEIERLFELYKSKPSDIGFIGRCPRSGKTITYDRAFCKKFASEFRMSSNYVQNLLQGKTIAWKEQYEKILGSKY